MYSMWQLCTYRPCFVPMLSLKSSILLTELEMQYSNLDLVNIRVYSPFKLKIVDSCSIYELNCLKPFLSLPDRSEFV